MSENNRGGIGGCIGTILIIMVVCAAFGLIEWETVGSFVRIIIYIFVAALILLVIYFAWIYFSGKGKD